MPEGLLYFPSKINQFVMKINLNREGDQFNRYQQNEHSSFTIAELPEHNNKQTTAYHVENPGPELGETQKCGGVKPVNGTPILPS
jgi:hypothetical protein